MSKIRFTEWQSRLLIPLITVKDKQRGTTHIVGENIHDCLEIHNGHIDYLNTQGYVGTQFDEECGYEFVADYDWDGDKSIKFVTADEIVKLAIKFWFRQRKDKRRLERYIKKQNKERKKNGKKS